MGVKTCVRACVSFYDGEITVKTEPSLTKEKKKKRVPEKKINNKIKAVKFTVYCA